MSRKPSRKGRALETRQKSSQAFLLDKFTDSDLRTWQKIADDLESYYVGLFYYLEGQRKLRYDEILDSLRGSGPVAQQIENWTRIVDYQYALTPLSAAGSLKRGGRFNIGADLDPTQFPAFPALYIADSYETAFCERFGVPTEGRDGLSGPELALRPPSSFTSVNIDGEIGSLFDLTTASSLRGFFDVIRGFRLPPHLLRLAKKLRLGPPYLVSSPQHLRENLLSPRWRQWPAQYAIPGNSQLFGRLLLDAGYEGIIFPSTKGQGKCAAVFPSNLAGSESFLALADAVPVGVEHTRLDYQSWQDLA